MIGQSKKAELLHIITIFAAIAVLSFGSYMIATDKSANQLTGAAIINPLCEQNPYSCIDLNGDGIVTYDDEDIFAKILLGEITYATNPNIYTMSDFNNDGTVDNSVDFQQCYVSIRDYYIDYKNREVKCNPPINNRTENINHSGCISGCADLSGDGYVNQEDFDILISDEVWEKEANLTNYPMGDLDGDNNIDQNDKDCMRPYLGKIVMCNLQRHANLSEDKCPDLTNEFNTNNDGFVDDYDKNIFYEYYDSENPKADLNSDGYWDWLDRIIFDDYYGKITDCNIYHAPWHVGGLESSNDNISEGNFVYVGNNNSASQKFLTSREGMLTKVRFYMEFFNGIPEDIDVILYPDFGGIPNSSVIIEKATIQAFGDNESHWVTAKFNNPPWLSNNTEYNLVLSVNSNDTLYKMFMSSVGLNSTNLALENIGSGWNENTGMSYIFETFLSTACADFNGDGIVDEDDETIIQEIPDNVTPSGTIGWNASLDINDDKIINSDDSNIIGTINQGRYYQLESCSGSSLETFKIDSNTSISQKIRPTIDKLYLVNVSLKRISEVSPNSSDVSDLVFEIRKSSGSSIDLSENGVVASKIIPKEDIDTDFTSYEIYFLTGVELDTSQDYFIRLSSTGTNVENYYTWAGTGTETCYRDSSYNVYRDNYTSVIDTLDTDASFIIFHGNSRDYFNESFDLNNDDWINGTDKELIDNAIVSYDPSWWLSLADFNAQYNIYEKLRDKTLGFDSYMGKAVSCGLPRYDELIGNKRCDEGENYISAPSDCAECNEDGFCAASENFANCSDCIYPPPLPRYRKFNGSTTDFENVSDIGKVSNAILEIVPYGAIVFEGHTLNFTGLDLDKYVRIGQGWVSINTTAPGMNALNVSTMVVLNNLSIYDPLILVDGNNCTSPQCEILQYPDNPDCDNNCTIGFYVSHFTTYNVVENDDSTKFINGPIENIVFDENEYYNFSSPNIDNYFFDADSDLLTYGFETKNSNIYATFVPNKTHPEYVLINSTINWVGETEVRFNATDGIAPAYSNWITLTVKPNLPPQEITGVLPTYLNWNEDENYTLDVSAAFFDGDEDDLSYKYNFVGERNGEGMNIISNNESDEIIFVPELNEYGEWFAHIIAKDEEYEISSANYIYLEVDSVNDIPKLLQIINDEVIDEDTNATPINLTRYFYDVEDNESNIELNFTFNNTPINFNYTIDNSILTLMPNNNWFGNENFVIKAQDSDGGISYSNEFTVFVIGTSDPIYRTNKTFNATWQQDTNHTLDLKEYFYDPDMNAIYSWTAPWKEAASKNITVQLNKQTGIIKFIPKSNWFGTEYINLSGEDSSGRVSELVVLNVTVENKAPYWDSNVENFTWSEDTNFSIYMRSYFKEDYGEKMFYSTNLLSNITILVNNSIDTITFVSDKDFYGQRNIQFTAVDESNTSAVSPIIKLIINNQNEHPEFSLANVSVNLNTTMIYDVSSKVSDKDDNLSAMIYLDNTTRFNINKTSGIIDWTPIVLENLSVLITVCDDSNEFNNCSSDVLLITVYNKTNSTFIDSWVDNIYYNGKYSNVTGVHDALINVSTLNGSTIFVSDSKIHESHITNSKVEQDSNIYRSVLINSDSINCTIYDSELYDSPCVNAFIDPSDIRRSDTTGSTILDSEIFDSNVTYSKAIDSDIYFSDVNLCDIVNSTLENSFARDCNITNDILYDGIMKYPNGTIYNATLNGPKSLEEIINYNPKAVILANPKSGTTSITTIFNGSLSTDININTSLNDYINYSWDFDDSNGISIDAIGSLVNHTYSIGTYTATLTVTDKYGKNDSTNVQIKITSPSTSSSGSGGGSGGGGGGSSGSSQSNEVTGLFVQNETCREDWICSEWSECISGSQERICEDWNSCGSEEFKPLVIQDCVIEDTKTQEQTSQATCYDRIKNQGETRVDCGGPCRACSPIVPKTPEIEEPVNEGKTNILIFMFFISSIVVMLGGAIAGGSYIMGPYAEKSYIDKLENYVTKRIQEGYSEKIIVEKMITEDIPEHIINEVLINIKE